MDQNCVNTIFFLRGKVSETVQKCLTFWLDGVYETITPILSIFSDFLSKKMFFQSLDLCPLLLSFSIAGTFAK